LLSGLIGALISRPSTQAHDLSDDVATLPVAAVDADLTLANESPSSDSNMNE
jgi:hypothetical protein